MIVNLFVCISLVIGEKLNNSFLFKIHVILLDILANSSIKTDSFFVSDNMIDNKSRRENIVASIINHSSG